MNHQLSRREWLAALTAAALHTALPGCRNAPPEAPPEPKSSNTYQPRWEMLDFPVKEKRKNPQRAMLLHGTQKGGPLLIALHGRGETRALEIGARAWRDDYAMGRAHKRLLAPPLTAKDFEDFVRPKRLTTLNTSLAKTPYQGIRVVCPYTPDLISADVDQAQDFARFLIDDLIPEVGRRSGGVPRPEETGIDGVSLGGRVALLVGLSHPEAFGAVSAMQPAISPTQASFFAQMASEARAKRPNLKMRLISSDGDPFKAAVNTLSQALTEASVPHDPLITPGPHDYAWNRGPGSVEMLLWFDRALRS